MNCLICNTTTIPHWRYPFAPFMIARMFGGTGKPNHLCECLECGFQFASCRPTEEEMRRHYSGYRGEDYTRQRVKYEPDYARINDAILNRREIIELRKRFLRDLINTDGLKVLDFGGDGSLIPDEWEAYPYDTYNAPTKELPGRIDLVACMHVLEHVPDPLLTAARVAEYRASAYYFEVPDEGGPRFPEIHEHINFFGKKSFRELLERIELAPSYFESVVRPNPYRDMRILCCLAKA